MCTIVYIGGAEIKSVGELKAAIGEQNVAFDFICVPAGDEGCLCSVNVPASARRAGYSYERIPVGY